MAIAFGIGSRAIYNRRMSISYEDALRATQGAHERARQIGISVTAAVVDEGGLLQALGRMSGAPPLSAQIAESKAVGAALWHRDGGSLAQVNQERPAFFQAVAQMVRLPIIPGLGSILIRLDGAVVGAIGVSGGKPDQDLDCAEHGLRALGI